MGQFNNVAFTGPGKIPATGQLSQNARETMMDATQVAFTGG